MLLFCCTIVAEGQVNVRPTAAVNITALRLDGSVCHVTQWWRSELSPFILYATDFSLFFLPLLIGSHFDRLNSLNVMEVRSLFGPKKWECRCFHINKMLNVNVTKHGAIARSESNQCHSLCKIHLFCSYRAKLLSSMKFVVIAIKTLMHLKLYWRILLKTYRRTAPVSFY